MKLILLSIALLIGFSGVAEAGPVAGAIAAVGTAFKAALTVSAITSFLVRTAISIGLSILSQKLQKKPRAAGLRSDGTTAGEATPASFILGRWATPGTAVCPAMTAGHSGETPNAFMTYVIDVSDRAVNGLDGLWINDERVPILPPNAGGLYPDHSEVGGKYAGRAWVKFFDGTQSEAYTAGLSGAGGAAVGRPWTSNMIGRGMAYLVARFKYDREVFQGFPEVVAEVRGIGLYDPRKDSSVGGTGPHRWGQSATYEFSENPIVQVYNILRGIGFADGSTWGGAVAEADLPLGNWIAAMNECDVLVGGAPQYRAGYEVRIGPEDLGGDEPAEVIEELLASCSGQIAERGGVYKVRVGPPGLPVAFFTDDDIIISADQQFEPFPAIGDTHNAIHAQYTEPAERWVSKEAPPRYNATYEAQDQGRRKIASVQFPAVRYRNQVQRLMRAWIEEERRFRRHVLTLPPDFNRIEELDAVAWSSERNGYSAKIFEVTARTDNLRTVSAQFGLRERDPNDYNWSPDFELPTTIVDPTTPEPEPRQVLGFNAEQTTVKDEAGVARRPAALLTWNGNQPDARALQYQIRPQGQTELCADGSTHAVEAGRLILSDGILSNTGYEARAKLVMNRKTLWTPWVQFHTLDVRLTGLDVAFDEIEGEVLENLAALEEWAGGTGAFLREIRDELAALLDGATESDFANFIEHVVIKDDYTAQITREQLARAGADSALAADIATVKVSLLDKADASALSALVSRIDTVDGQIIAQADAITQVNARVGEYSANGLFRVTAEATPTGAESRIGLRAEASDDESTHSAAMFLVARTDGTNEVIFQADRFSVATSDAANATRSVPFVVDGGIVYIDEAYIRTASIASYHLGDGIINSAKIANVIQSTNYTPGVDGDGWLIQKNGTAVFNNVIIRRQLEVATGTVNIGAFDTSQNAVGSGARGTIELEKTDWVLSTPIPFASWMGSKKTYLANVEIVSGTAYGTPGTPDNTRYWGWIADVLPLNIWGGGSQSLRLRLQFWSRNINGMADAVIRWKIYEVS